MSYKKSAFKKKKVQMDVLTEPKYIVSPRLYERFLELGKPNLSKEEMLEKCLIILTAEKQN